MGPTPKQVAGIVLVLGGAMVGVVFKDEQWIAILACGVGAWLGVVLLVKGERDGRR